MIEIFQGETGKEFEIDTTINLIGIERKKIIITKPDNSQIYWNCEIKDNKKGQPGILYFINEDSKDFDQLGVYKIQGCIKFHGKSEQYTKIGNFKIVSSTVKQCI